MLSTRSHCYAQTRRAGMAFVIRSFVSPPPPVGARTEKMSARLEPATSTIVFASTLDHSRRLNPTTRYNGCLARFRDQHAQLACAATSSLVQFQDRTTKEAPVNGVFSSPCSNSRPTYTPIYLYMRAYSSSSSNGTVSARRNVVGGYILKAKCPNLPRWV